MAHMGYSSGILELPLPKPCAISFEVLGSSLGGC